MTVENLGNWFEFSRGLIVCAAPKSVIAIARRIDLCCAHLWISPKIKWDASLR
jgi:hypothetical protein